MNRAADASTEEDGLRREIAGIPSGPWVIGVSGGADSVALLCLAAARRDLQLHVAHLNHQTRGTQNDEDAAFVRALCDRLGAPCSIAKISDLPTKTIIANASARFRTARLAFYQQVVASNSAQGVLLAHHADDQAETVLRRLLRGEDPAALTGIADVATVNGLRIVRPLLAVRRSTLRGHLQSIGQTWREDPSNASADYERNRLRMALGEDGTLTLQLLQLQTAARGYARWLDSVLPAPATDLPMAVVARLPEVVGRILIRRWLIDAGCSAPALDAATVQRVWEMATDMATPPRLQVAGGITIGRRKAVLRAGQSRLPDRK